MKRRSQGVSYQNRNYSYKSTPSSRRSTFGVGSNQWNQIQEKPMKGLSVKKDKQFDRENRNNLGLLRTYNYIRYPAKKNSRQSSVSGKSKQKLKSHKNTVQSQQNQSKLSTIKKQPNWQHYSKPYVNEYKPLEQHHQNIIFHQKQIKNTKTKNRTIKLRQRFQTLEQTLQMKNITLSSLAKGLDKFQQDAKNNLYYLTILQQRLRQNQMEKQLFRGHSRSLYIQD